MASCMASAPALPEIGMAHAEHVPTQHAMASAAGESTAADRSEEMELERAIKASLEQASVEEDEVARAIKASLEVQRKPALREDDDDVLAAIQASRKSEEEDKFRREAQEAAELAIASRASLEEYEQMRHVAEAAPQPKRNIDQSEHADEEEAVTCWTLKLQRGSDAWRVPVFWRLEAGPEEVYQRILEAAKSSAPEGSGDSQMVFEQRQGAVCNEVVLTAASVSELLTSGSQGLLHIVLKGHSEAGRAAAVTEYQWCYLSKTEVSGVIWSLPHPAMYSGVELVHSLAGLLILGPKSTWHCNRWFCSAQENKCGCIAMSPAEATSSCPLWMTSSTVEVQFEVVNRKVLHGQYDLLCMQSNCKHIAEALVSEWCGGCSGRKTVVYCNASLFSKMPA
eukprot:3089303-Amphidinium_carterae.1